MKQKSKVLNMQNLAMADEVGFEPTCRSYRQTDFELFAFKSFDVTLCVNMSNSGSAESLDFTGFHGFWSLEVR